MGVGLVGVGLILLRLPLAAGCLLAPLPLAVALAGPAQGGLATRTTAVLALYLVLQALAVVAPGALGSLQLPQVLAAEALLAAPWLWRGWRRPVQAQVQAWLRETGSYLSGLTLAERLALTAILAGAAGATAVMVLAPSSDYDTWMYQLPQVAEWLQHGLAATPEQWQEAHTFAHGLTYYPGGGIPYYPGDWTALTWLATATLGCDVLALVPNLAGWALLGLATISLARALGAERSAALAAAGLVMTVPMAGLNLDSAHVDLGQGGLLAALLALVVSSARSGCTVAPLLALATAGMLAGTKMSALPELGLAGALAVALLPGPGRAAAGSRPVLAAIAGASLALLGCWWYARNWALTGNPLGFVAVPLFHWPGAIDAGYIARTSLVHSFALARPWHWLLVSGALLAFIGPLPLVAVPALAAGIAQRRWRGWRELRLALGLAFTAVALLLLYVDGPWSAKQALDPDLSWWLGQQLRYTWTLWAVVAAFAAAAGGRCAAPLVLAGLALLQAAWLPWSTGAWFLAAPAVLAAGAAAWWLLGHAQHHQRERGAGGLGAQPLLRSLAALAALLVLLTLIGAPLRSWWLDRVGWGVPRLLASRCASGEPVAFWGSHQSWLLYGDDLRRPVTYLDLDSWHADTPAAARAIAGELRGSGVRYLALGPRWRDFPPEGYRVIDDHPDVFERVLGEPPVWGMTLYRIRGQ